MDLIRRRPGTSCAVPAALCMATMLAACASVPRQTPLMRATDSHVAVRELRATANALAVSAPAEIETSADEIMSRAADPAVRHQALLWKMERTLRPVGSAASE